MCLGDWKSHGSEYYECSRYKENPNIANESVHAQVTTEIFFAPSIFPKTFFLLKPGPRSAEKVSPLLRAVGKPRQVPPARTADTGQAESKDKRESHEGIELVDVD
jgi:hypothetical protein